MPFGPQQGSGFLSPTPQQPQMQPGAGQYDDWSMQNQAQQQAAMYAMHGMLNQQNQGTMQQGAMLGARGANYALGNPVGQALQPVGNALRSGASAIKNLVGGAAQQSYTQGGATTLAAGSPGLSGSAAAAAPSAYGNAGAAASQATLDSAGQSLGSLAGGALSLGGTAYGTYNSFQGANRTLDNLHQALTYGLSDEDEAKLRQETFDAGIKNAAIGGLAGMVGGAVSGGPVTGILGGAAGLAGGAYQAWQSQDSNKGRFEAQKAFQEHPWR